MPPENPRFVKPARVPTFLRFAGNDDRRRGRDGTDAWHNRQRSANRPIIKLVPVGFAFAAQRVHAGSRMASPFARHFGFPETH